MFEINSHREILHRQWIKPATSGLQIRCSPYWAKPVDMPVFLLLINVKDIKEYTDIQLKSLYCISNIITGMKNIYIISKYCQLRIYKQCFQTNWHNYSKT
jgi:hypothetical protein